MRVACLQLNSQDDVSANLAIVARLLTQAADQEAVLVALPEMFAVMHPDRQRKFQFATQEAHQKVLPFLADQARRHRITIIGGTLLLANAEQLLRNCCPVFSPAGNLIATYDKIHLFDSDLADRSYRESEQVIPGNTPEIVALDKWRIGLSICYDLRFPELYRYYASHGANILTVPSAFAVPTGSAHWDVLLRARAIENQAYVLAPAQIGSHPGGRATYGHSMIVDPWGTVIARATNDSPEGELIIADLSQQHLDEIRRQLPALTHRRDALFPAPRQPGPAPK